MVSNSTILCNRGQNRPRALDSVPRLKPLRSLCLSEIRFSPRYLKFKDKDEKSELQKRNFSEVDNLVTHLYPGPISLPSYLFHDRRYAQASSNLLLFLFRSSTYYSTTSISGR
ncbi:predicted protein [Histoplasma capsulatum var. duboisii H88]|uniref:Predicted protein n=2 Tax=Ajellomyces capsulatus TaxID=5037 RepID=F0URB9_AJEC8|nr:predicted protein [Histoplasma capsulatum H143]EGC48446.1 predicted protein [Histoplasma capsulatum var. duboisii H88]